MNNKQEIDGRVKKRINTWKEFVLTYLAMLLLIGFQMGIIVSPVFAKIIPVLQVAIVMGYWAVVAAIFIYLTNIQLKQSYDAPMRRLSDAAKKVADGDFSVYAEPTHTPDKYDFIDVMFLDFNTMVQELGSIETLKNDFVANVSHELKTPLAIIRNYTSLLKKGGLSETTQTEYMDAIIKATDNLSILISNILRLNKLENQEIAYSIEPYDLCRQLSDCVISFETLLDKKDIEFTADIEDRATICADKEMLEIVWNNLLSNAIKYTEQGGKVSVVQTSDTDTISVSIIDTGCGMDESTIKHIFDKFYQADTSHSVEGNGLGLALAYRIVEKLDGALTVKSEPGKGSTFTVTIPINL